MDPKGLMVRGSRPTSHLGGNVEKGPRWWCFDLEPVFRVFEEAVNRELRRSRLQGVVQVPSPTGCHMSRQSAIAISPPQVGFSKPSLDPGQPTGIEMVAP